MFKMLERAVERARDLRADAETVVDIARASLPNPSVIIGRVLREKIMKPDIPMEPEADPLRKIGRSPLL